MTTAGAPPSAEPVKAALKREPSADSSSSSSAAAPPASTRSPGTSGGVASNSKHTGRQVTRRQSVNRSMRRLLLVLLAVATLTQLAAAAPASALPPVRHVFVIVLENKGVEDTFGPTGWLNAPYLSQELPSKGQLLLRYYGIGHNSLDNYIAMVSGQPPTPKTKDDCPDPLTSVGTEAIHPYN